MAVDMGPKPGGEVHAAFSAAHARDSWEMFLHGGTNNQTTDGTSERPASAFTPDQQELADRGFIVPGIRKDTEAIVIDPNGQPRATEVVAFPFKAGDGERHTLRIPKDTSIMAISDRPRSWNI